MLRANRRHILNKMALILLWCLFLQSLRKKVRTISKLTINFKEIDNFNLYYIKREKHFKIVKFIFLI